MLPPERANRDQLSFPSAAAPTRGAIQTKLVIGKTNDPLEHEADRVADQVMRMPAPGIFMTSAPPQVTRKCAACEEEEQKVQAKIVNEHTVPSSDAPPIVNDVLSSPGQPLDASTRAFFEPRFGLQFAQVRVHTDEKAAASAGVMGALAYTVGRHVVFADGQYAPDSTAGRFLFAHELAHVAQQGETSTIIRRMAPCPSSLADDDPVPSGWKPYFGKTGVFHCGFRTILEDRSPTPDDPENECVYDHTGALVDENHPYAGCRGTPDQYDSKEHPIKHTFIDSGGIVKAGADAFITSRVHDIDEAIASAIRVIQGAAAITSGLINALGTAIATGILTGIATCDPGNWTFNGLPARSMRHLSVIGGILSSVGLAGSVNAVATNLTRRLDSFPIANLLSELARDINEALAAIGSNVQVSASTLGVLSLYALVDWLHTQGIIDYSTPPEEIAKQRLANPSP